jgi:hypothetical protein
MLSMTIPGSAPPAPRVGDPEIILDDPRFVITGEHARGGMSIIYRATDTWLGRQVAIKACRTRDPSAWARLEREASMLSRLDHPWILPVYHSGTTVTGAPYLATKLVEGETLEQRLKREPAAWPALLRHVVDVADAMAYAHGRAVVHRDLKPGNILIDAQGHTIVIDWGLARETPERAAQAPSPPVTLPGAAVGTPGYWAPEQRAGDVCDPRADVYSVGAILYRMITGRAAHPMVPMGADLERDLAAAPSGLRALVAHATQPDTEKRHQTMAALAGELRAALPRPSVLQRGLVHGARRRRILTAAAITLLGAALIVAGATLLGRDERPGLAARALTEVPIWTGNFGRMLLEMGEGGRVHGVYEHDDGVLEGTLRGHVLQLRWCEAPYLTGHDHGTATLAFVAEAAGLPSFAGSYGYAGDARLGGAWVLHPAPAAAQTPELRARLAGWAWRCPAE